MESTLGQSADRTGTEVARTLSEQIADGIRKGLDSWPKNNPTREPARRQGAESGGAFGDAFKARVKAAIDDLPKIEVDADTTPARRELAEVRAAMVELGDKKIGVDISAADAMTQLAALRTRLDALTGSDVDVQVRTDAAAASAELARVQAQVDELDGSTAEVEVNVDKDGSASGSIAGLAGK